MADTKLTALSAITTPTKDDLLYLVDDPGGTPAEGKLALEDLFKVIGDLTADATPTDDDLIVTINDPGGTPAPRKVVISNFRRIVQVVNTQTGAVNTGTTSIPFDDTIPQNTEGDEYMTLAITPKSATNKLLIEIVIQLSPLVAPDNMTAALFQDATAGALAAKSEFFSTATGVQGISFSHYMTSGTTSSTTFKVRAGTNGATTTTFNGQSGNRKFGGVMASSITITEILA